VYDIATSRSGARHGDVHRYRGLDRARRRNWATRDDANCSATTMRWCEKNWPRSAAARWAPPATVCSLLSMDPRERSAVHVRCVSASTPWDYRYARDCTLGECELTGDNVVGIAVHIGAHVSAIAGPDEVWSPAR
jgi:hypothetical protein